MTNPERTTQERAIDLSKRLAIFVEGLQDDIKNGLNDTEQLKSHFLLKTQAILNTLKDLHSNLSFKLQKEIEAEEEEDGLADVNNLD